MLSLFAAAALAVPSPVSCTPASSTRTTVAEIGKNLDRFMGKCVTVSGPFTGLAMFGSREDMYLTGQFENGSSYDLAAEKKGRLGLDSPDSELRGLKLNELQRIDVTGTIDSCERRGADARAKERAPQKDGEIIIVMLTGYCHYYRGAVLSAESWSFDPSTHYERLVGDGARQKFGNLEEMDDDWPFASQLRSMSAKFLDALRAGDRAELIRLHDADTRDSDSDLLQTLLESDNSPFVQVRSNPAPQTQIFVDRVEAERDQLGKPPKTELGLACYCRSKDCTGRWPVSFRDADNDVSRPYVCTEIRREDWENGKLILDTPIENGAWLLEPAKTAFHPR